MKQRSASEIKFGEYTRWISTLFIDKFGPSFATQDSVRNRWRYDFKYSVAAEQFLILQTKTFIATMDSADPNSTNPVFLMALINMIADYLSAYTMRAFCTTDDKDAARKNRKKAKAILSDTLYTNNTYIQGLLKQQIKKRNLKNSGRTAREHAARHEQNVKDAAERNIQYQVQRLFVEYDKNYKKH